MSLDKAEPNETVDACDLRIEQVSISLLSELRFEDLGQNLRRVVGQRADGQLTQALLPLGRAATRKLEQERIGGLPKVSLRTALHYTGDSLAEDLTLAEIAHKVHMSPYHFLECSSSPRGSPRQYAIRQRIE